MTSTPVTSPAAGDDAGARAQIAQLVADAETYQNDVDRFTSMLTDDVSIVNFAGIRVNGRARFRDAMEKAVGSRLVNVLTRNELVDIKFLRPDVAVVACIKHISDENADARGDLPAQGTLTFVVVHDKGGWKIASAQTTPIRR